MKPVLQPADVLFGAANIIRTRGWTVDTYEDKDGRCCIVGAMRNAAFREDVECSATVYTVARRAMEAEVKKIWADPLAQDEDSMPHLPNWNDQLPDDSGELVASLLEKVARSFEVPA